jgi:hypothetical protein
MTEQAATELSVMRLGKARRGETRQGKTMTETFERSIETTLAIKVLRDLPVGEIVTYSELAEAIGKDPQRDGYCYVSRAREILEKELEIVFAAVPNEGIKRLNPREVINLLGDRVGHLRRHSNKSVRKGTTIVPIEQQGELGNEERLQFHEKMSHLAVIAHALTPKASRKLREAVKEANKSLPVGDLIRLFAPDNNDND